MDIHRHIFLLSGFENTFFFSFHLRFSSYPVTTTIIWPTSDRIPHSFNFEENANQENCRQCSCIIFFNWQIGTKNLTKKKINVEPSFFTSWTITSVNAHGRTCKKTKVYIYLYISLYENLFENGCNIYIYIYIYNLHGLSCQEKVSRFSMLLIPRYGTSLAVS